MCASLTKNSVKDTRKHKRKLYLEIDDLAWGKLKNGGRVSAREPRQHQQGSEYYPLGLAHSAVAVP